MHWGVDSARASNTAAADGVTMAFDAVTTRAGAPPEFWGRYIGGNYATTTAEVAYLQNKNCRVFLTYNGTSSSDVQGSIDDGKNDAAAAAAAALQLGAPAGVALFADVENSWVPSAEWIQGWVTGIITNSNGYLPGFYCDATPGKAFDIAYCAAVAAEPNVANALLWSMEGQPNPQCQAAGNAPSFNPQNVRCNNNSCMWQYTIDCWEDLLGDNAGIDMDQANDAAFQAMWALPVLSRRRRGDFRHHQPATAILTPNFNKETRMNSGNSTCNWNQSVWANINKNVKTAVFNIRVAQKVFPAIQLSGVTSVPANIINVENMSVSEGDTQPYTEISAEFSLSYGQVNDDPNGVTVTTIAKLAAKSLALAEDILFFHGKEAHANLPPAVRVESGRESARQGMLALAGNRTIEVHPPDQAAPTNSGAEILKGLAKGIAKLTKEGQAPPFGLILGTNAFAATWGSVINGAPTYTVLNPIITQGIFGTGAMPPDEGLLVALGGDPTTIYYDADPVTEQTHRDSQGRYQFRVFERVTFVPSDQRAFVKLNFLDRESSQKR